MSHTDLTNSQPPSRVSRLAGAAFITSIALFLLSFLILPGLLALGLGTLAQMRIERSRGKLGGLGYAEWAGTIGLTSFCVGILLDLFVLTMAPGSHSGPLSGRSACAANLKGIAQSMIVYANENDDSFPVVSYAPYNAALNSPTASTAPTPDAALASYYTRTPAQAGSVTACAWILVLRGQVAPKGFICPDDPFVTRPAAQTDPAGRAYDNFQSLSQLSYSFAYPWKADGTVGAWWKNTTDAGIPVAADMAPEDSTGSPPRTLTTATRPKLPAQWNSPNHKGDGQNVAFADGHAEFCRTPLASPTDNIWTTSAAPSPGPAPYGGIPASRSHGPELTANQPPFDIVMYPVRNATTGR
ncbi:MAG TPA: hypothetical protein VH253_13760 [Phycisphaerae bacterium]|nr:hypothetical protein [Phycisphaerae bacterium]